MTEIKTINISGTAASDISGGKRGRRSTKKKQEGGFDEPVRGVSNVMNIVKGVESTASAASTAGSSNSSTWLKYPTGAPVPPPVNTHPVPSYIPTNPNNVAAPIQQGGTKSIQVELKKKSVTKKVHLIPKKSDAQKTIAKKHQTKKIRKVTIGVSSLHKRITRAKKLHKNVKEMPLDKLKEKLIKGGLIKPTSKAPESILRQIASDAEVVANKAL